MEVQTAITLAIASMGGQKAVALKIGLSESDLSRKLNGERGWKLPELQKLFDLCDLRLSISFREKEDEDFETTYLLTRKLTEAMGMLKALKKKEAINDGGTQQRVSDAA